MTATAAQMAANIANAARSTGPKSVEGKERSRANSLKHGMTGAGVVLSKEDAAEVGRRFLAFHEELQPSGPIGDVLVRRAAVCSVRMDRGVEQEFAALAEHVERAEADFVAPEGSDPETAARLRAEAGRRATFDPSREAILARKYEAWAERGFFRALKELGLLKKTSKAMDPALQAELFRQELGSILAPDNFDAEMDAMEARLDKEDREKGLATPPKGVQPSPMSRFPAQKSSFDVPFAIGRAQ